MVHNNFSNLIKTINQRCKKAQWTPETRKVNKITWKSKSKFLKTSNKQEILKAYRSKRTCYMQKSKDKDRSFSPETTQVRR